MEKKETTVEPALEVHEESLIKETQMTNQQLPVEGIYSPLDVETPSADEDLVDVQQLSIDKRTVVTFSSGSSVNGNNENGRVNDGSNEPTVMRSTVTKLLTASHIRKRYLYRRFNLKTDDDDHDHDHDDEHNASPGPGDSPTAAVRKKVNKMKEVHFSKPKQGRVYDNKHSQEPGGIRLDDMIFGVKMAHLSCTDDTEDRLKKSGPNSLATLKHIVGGNEEDNDFRKPLSTILKDKFDLKMETWMDVSGFIRGRPVDTQGFIASNENTIVLSYRFSTTALDWMTNLSWTTTHWSPERAEKIGHAGYCSCMTGLRHLGRKPRYHTGYYNNFIYTIAMIRKHIIEPIMNANKEYQKNKQVIKPAPIKIYVCGASLGAAIATIASCFLLMELPLEDPDFLPVKLISVTLGCPRVCNQKARQAVQERLALLRPLDRAVFCRLVYNQDLVPHLPISSVILRFAHLPKLVYLTQDGDIIINPRLILYKEGFWEISRVFQTFLRDQKGAAMAKLHYYTGGILPEDPGPGQANSAARESARDISAEFAKEVQATPGPVRDHMPFWYLSTLENAKAKEDRAHLWTAPHT